MRSLKRGAPAILAGLVLLATFGVSLVATRAHVRQKPVPSGGRLPRAHLVEGPESVQHEAVADQDVGGGQCEPAVVAHDWNVPTKR